MNSDTIEQTIQHDPSTKTVTLEVSIEQAEIISESVEFLSRVLLGHLPVIAEKIQDAPGVSTEYANQLKEELYQTQQRLGLHTAMHSEAAPEKSQISWDIHQVLRQVLFQANERKERYVVDADDPSPACSHPLAKATINGTT